MKLLMTTDAVGGVWTYALDLCSALSGFGIDVVLAALGPRPRASQRVGLQRLSNVELIESQHPLEWMEEPWREVDAAGEWLLREAHARDVDLVHLNGYAHAGLLWNRPVLSVAHSCVITWWQAVHGEQAPPRWSEYRKRVRAGLTAADRVVAPTRAFAKQIAEAHELDRSIEVIHNGRALECADRLRGDASHAVVACGRAWDEAKNFVLLDDIAQRCPWPIQLIGPSESPSGTRWKPRHLCCLGEMSAAQVNARLASAAIFVHPALYEPFGLAIAEAALTRCCLVLADLPGLRELWDEAAVFFDPRRAESLESALNAVIGNPELRESLAQCAAQRAQTYSSQVMARRYFDLYREMVGADRPARKAVA